MCRNPSCFVSTPFVKKILDTLKCSSGNGIVENPYMCPCPSNHLFCASCILPHLEAQPSNSKKKAAPKKLQCPACQFPISSKADVQPCRAAEQMLENLDVYCDHNDHGCLFIGPLRTLPTHLATECIHHSPSSKSSANQSSSSCPHGCSAAVLSPASLKEHESTCPCFIIPCPNAAAIGCTKSCPRSAMQHHLQTCLVSTISEFMSRLKPLEQVAQTLSSFLPILQSLASSASASSSSSSSSSSSNSFFSSPSSSFFSSPFSSASSFSAVRAPPLPDASIEDRIQAALLPHTRQLEALEESVKRKDESVRHELDRLQQSKQQLSHHLLNVDAELVSCMTVLRYRLEEMDRKHSVALAEASAFQIQSNNVQSKRVALLESELVALHEQAQAYVASAAAVAAPQQNQVSSTLSSLSSSLSEISSSLPSSLLNDPSFSSKLQSLDAMMKQFQSTVSDFSSKLPLVPSGTPAASQPPQQQSQQPQQPQQQPKVKGKAQKSSQPPAPVVEEQPAAGSSIQKPMVVIDDEEEPSQQPASQSQSSSKRKRSPASLSSSPVKEEPVANGAEAAAPAAPIAAPATPSSQAVVPVAPKPKAASQASIDSKCPLTPEEIEQPPGVYLHKKLNDFCGTFRWKVQGVSSSSNRLYSPIFELGGHSWRLFMYPQGNSKKPESKECLAIYLDLADAEGKPAAWSIMASFSMSVLNSKDVEKHKTHESTPFRFTSSKHDIGFPTFMPLSALYEDTAGFMVYDCIYVQLTIQVLQHSPVDQKLMAMLKAESQTVITVQIVLDEHMKLNKGYGFILSEGLQPIKVRKGCLLGDFKRKLFDRFGIRSEHQRLWLWSVLDGKTHKVVQCLPQVRDQDGAFFADISAHASTYIYMETLTPPRVMFEPIKPDDLLLFVKYYDPADPSFQYLGSVVVKKEHFVADLVPYLAQLRPIIWGPSISAYHEFRSSSMNLIDPTKSLQDCGLSHSSVIVVQRNLPEEEAAAYSHPHAASYFQHLLYQAVVKCF